MPAVATISAPSKNARVRSNSVICVETASSSSEWRVEGVGRTRVGADSLDTDAADRALIRQPLSQFDIDARRVRTGFVRIQERLLVTRTGVPAGAVKQPAALRQRAVLPLERPNV